MKMRATSGPSFSGSSRSAALQSSLASRLPAVLAGRGSPLFALTWKNWDMVWGPPICALRASAPRISGNGSTGWPTTTAHDAGRGGQGKRAMGETRHGSNLQDFAQLTGWPTPTSQDAASSGASNYSTDSGRHAGTTLTDAARFSGWPTPCGQDGPKGGPGQGSDRLPAAASLVGWPTPTKGNADGSQMAKDASATGKRPDGSKATVSLNQVASLAGWPTTTAMDAKSAARHGYMIQGNQGTTLLDAARLAGWATPTARDHKDGEPCPNVPENAHPGRQVWQASGTPSNGSPAATGSGGQLNPDFSLWLMGYPAAWGSCGARAMRSCRKPPRRSSKRTAA